VRDSVERRGERGADAPDLTAALRDIHERLDRQAAAPMEIDSRPLEDLARRIDDMRATLADHALARPDPSAWEPALREISDKLDRHAISSEDSRALIEVVQDLAARVDGAAGARVDSSPIEAALRDLSERISATAPAAVDVASIERLLNGLDVRLEEVARATSDTRALEGAIHSLRDELAQRPDSQIDVRLIEQAAEMMAQRFEKTNVAAFDTEALVNQISEIHGRLDTLKIASTSNAALERTVTELIEELETTGRILKSAAAQSNVLAPLASGIAELRTEQANSDRRMETRLFGVQGVLEKLADRLARLEDDEERDDEDLPPPPRAEFSSRPAPQPASLKPQVGGVFNLRSIPDREDGAARAAPVATKAARVVETPSVTIDPGEGSPARNAAINAHIAAARRAAQTAMVEHAEKADAPVAAPRAPKPRLSTGSPLAQAGALIARHRRPILLGATAAALTVAATVAVVELRGGHVREAQKSELMAPTGATAPEAEAPAKSAAALDYNPTGAIEAAPAKSAPPAVIAAPPAAGPAKAVPADLVASLPTTVSAALRDGAASGDVGAEFEIGLRYLDGRTIARDVKQAARWLELAANQGLPIAQYRYAALYEKGTGVARDFAQARAWYLKAANAGNARAMHNLAVLTAQDAGAGKPDYAQAAQWFRRAADFGIRDSQYNLGVLYGRGLGVPQELGNSWLWFSLASRQGDTDAAKKRDEVQAKMDATQLAAATKALAEFKPRPLDSSANDAPAPSGGWDGAPQAGRPAKAGGSQQL
jgi:localization factor PodJL